MTSSALLASLLLAAAPGQGPLRLALTHHQLKQAQPAPALQAGAAVAPACSDAQGRPVTCDPATMLQVQYFGGRVIPNAKVYAVFWTAAVAAETQAGIGGFYQAVTNSPWMDWLTEYTTPASGGSNQVIGRGVYAGAVVITPVTPARPCVATSAGTIPSGTCVWESDIPAELDAQITAGHLPAPDPDTLYMVHFPATVVIQSQDRTPANILDSCVQYCSIHGTYTRSGFGSVYYAMMPDMGTNGCQSGCGTGTTFANLCSATSHELGEAITDAEVGLVTGSANAAPLAWYDGATVSQGEIGDMCNQATAAVTSPFTGASYTVQTLFSRTIWAAAPAVSTPACVSAARAASDFAVFFDPGTLAVAPGGTASIPVHLETTSGAAQAVTLAPGGASVLPAGVHATLSATSVVPGPPGGPPVAQLQLSVDPGTPLASDRLVVIEARAGAQVHSAAVLLQVTAAPPNDWALTISPAGQFVPDGGQASYAVSASLVAGSPESIALAPAGVAGLPPGVTAAFAPAAITAGGTSTLTLTAAGGASPTAGAVAFSVRGTSASQGAGHVAFADVTVDGLPSVAITAPQDGSTLAGTVPITLATAPGVNASLQGAALLVDGAAYAGPLAWDTTVLANGQHRLDATATDTDGGTASAAPVRVTVANDFAMSLSPSQGTLVPGAGAATFTVTATGTTRSITLSATGLPPGVTATFAPAVVDAGGTSRLTLAAAGGAPPTTGAATFTVQGSSPNQAAARFAGAGVIVDGLPSVAITAPLAGATVAGTVTITLAVTPGANTSLQGTALRIDGAAYGGPLAWDTTALANGPHTLDATATDADGGTTAAAQVRVMVANQPPPAPSSKGGCSTGGGDLGILGALGLALALARSARRRPGRPGRDPTRAGG